MDVTTHVRQTKHTTRKQLAAELALPQVFAHNDLDVMTHAEKTKNENTSHVSAKQLPESFVLQQHELASSRLQPAPLDQTLSDPKGPEKWLASPNMGSYGAPL